MSELLPTLDARYIAETRGAKLRRLAGKLKYPGVMASPPTQTMTTGATPTPIATANLPSGLSKAYVATQNDGAIAYYGGKLVAQSGSTLWYSQQTTTNAGAGDLPGGSGIMYNFTLEIETDAPEVCFVSLPGTYGSRFLVDDEFVSLTDAASLPNAFPNYFPLNFGSRALGGRRIRWEFGSYSNLTSFWQILVDPLSRVWKPPQTDVIRCIGLGTSLTMGAYANHPCGSYLHHMARYLGWRDVWNSGLAGSGFLVSGLPTFRQRVVTDVINNNPDVVVIEGGQNDANVPGIQTEVTLLIQQIRAALPNVLIYVLGVPGISSGPSATVIAIENMISAAVAALNDPLTFFIPMSGPLALEPVFFGTGDSVSPNGSGNSDVYAVGGGIHYNDNGAQYFGNRVACAIHSTFKQIA